MTSSYRKSFAWGFFVGFTILLVGKQTFSSQYYSSSGLSSYGLQRKKNDATLLVSSSLPPIRELTGSWIGNTWVPPLPWRLYSPSEMRDVYRGQRILFVGDSLARRAAMTLFPILNATTRNVPVAQVDSEYDLSLNKHGIQVPCTDYQWNGKDSPKICRTVMDVVLEDDETINVTDNSNTTGTSSNTPETSTQHQHKGGGQVMQMWKPCFEDLTDFCQSEVRGMTNLTDNLDIMVVSASLHEYQKTYCSYQGEIQDPKTDLFFHELYEGMFERQLLLLQALVLLQRAKPHLRIVWKTAGFLSYDDDHHNRQRIVQRTNEVAMDFLDSYYQQQQQQQQANNNNPVVHYVHWGGAIEARSFDDERIQGDMTGHYGLEARLVVLQMLTNVLAAAP